MRRSGAPRLQPVFLLALLLGVPFVSLPMAAKAGAQPASTAHGISVQGDDIVVQTSTLSIVLSIPKDGAIVNITNAMTGQYLKLNQSLSTYLWSVDDFHQIRSSSDANQFNYTISQASNSTNLQMVWQVPGYYVVHALVEAMSSGYIGMKVNVTNVNPDEEIERVIFPYIGGVESMGSSTADNYITIPEREGYVVNNVTGSIIKDPISLQYPGSLSMQYVYWYEQNQGGIYLGMQDNMSNYKGLELLRQGLYSYNFDWYQYAADIVPGDSYQMDYFAMFKGVQGTDWTAGAQVYQSWALKQWYVSAGTVAQRTDIPTWVKQLDFVWGTTEYMTNMSTDQIYLAGTPLSQMGNFTQQVRAILPNANLMLYLAGWNQLGFDRGYPDYYPPRDGVQALKQAISATHAQGIKVMLYLNGRLVDKTTPVYNQSLPYLTVNGTGFPDSISYDNGTLTGGIPVPTSQWWTNEVLNFTDTAVGEYGADGVFLDQNTVASPQLDMSTTHGHLPGGGSWWWQAEAQLLDTVRASIRQINPQAMLSSENVNEVYIKDVDLYQSYDWEYDFQNLYPLGFAAPLFAYVYHGYVLQYTSYLLPFGVGDYAEGSFLEGISSSIADGYIPGVSTSLTPSATWWFTKASRSIIQSVVETRQEFRQFLAYGTTPPTTATIDSPSAFYMGAPVFVRNLTGPSIYTGEFQLPDGREAMVLSNMEAGRNSSAAGFLPNGLVPQSNQNYLVTESVDNRTVSVFEIKGSEPLEVTVPRLSVVTLTLEPAPSTFDVSFTYGVPGPSYAVTYASSSESVAMQRSSSSDSLNVSLVEPSTSGFVHLLFPNSVLGSSSGGPFRTLLDGRTANATVFQNSTVTSVFLSYGKGSHTISMIKLNPDSTFSGFFRSLTDDFAQAFSKSNVLYVGVTALLLVLVAYGSLNMMQRRRKF